MAEVKWIKLSTELFNNRKIKQIECLPEGNAVIVMWVKLLCLAPVRVLADAFLLSFADFPAVKPLCLAIYPGKHPQRHIANGQAASGCPVRILCRCFSAVRSGGQAAMPCHLSRNTPIKAHCRRSAGQPCPCPDPLQMLFCCPCAETVSRSPVRILCRCFSAVRSGGQAVMPCPRSCPCRCFSAPVR